MGKLPEDEVDEFGLEYLDDFETELNTEDEPRRLVQDEARYEEDGAYYEEDEAYYEEDEAYYEEDEAYYEEDEAYYEEDGPRGMDGERRYFDDEEVADIESERRYFDDEEVKDIESERHYFEEEEYPKRLDQRKNPRSIKSSRTRLATIAGYLSIVMLVAIVGLLGFTVIRLWQWNNGITIEAAAEEEAAAFDVEIEDQVILREEDLESVQASERILCLGNAPFSDDTGATGLAGRIGAYTGGEVLNASFPGSRVAAKNPQYDPNYPMDVLSFFYVAEFLRQGDVSAMSNVAEQYSNAQYMAAIEAMNEALREAPDTIVIMYDATDYIDGSPCYDEENEVNPMSFAGAYRYGLMALKERFPDARIIVLSMTWCLTYDSEGNMLDADMVDMGNGKLPAYWTKLFDVCDAEGVTFIDNYYGTVSVDNVQEYLVDNIHLTEAACDHIAKHMVEAVYGTGDPMGTPEAGAEEEEEENP